MFRGQKTFKFKCLTTQTKSYFLLQNLLQWTGKEHPDCSLLLGTERALRSVLCRCHVILEEDVRWEEEEEEEEAEQRSEHHHEKHLQKHLESQIHRERLCLCFALSCSDAVVVASGSSANCCRRNQHTRGECQQGSNAAAQR